jgi:hypothetical protein
MPLAGVHIQAQQGHAKAGAWQRPRLARENSMWFATLTETPVYREPFSAQQQIRAVTLRFL